MSDQEEYENRLRRRLQILKEEIDKGKVHIAKGLHTIESLEKVRYGPDGEIDLESVDGFVRSLALAVEYQHDREEAKSIISLREIQRIYFEFIDANFGEYYNIMLDKKVTPHQIAKHISESNIDDEINYLNDGIEDFISKINEFWKYNLDIAYYHLEDSYKTIKGVYGGDLFAANDENIVSKSGIYIDTIILPDPFIRSSSLFEYWNKKERVYYLFKHALNILQYKELALLDIDIPIVVILPEKSNYDEFYGEQLKIIGDNDALYHASKIFGRSFNNVDEMYNYANELDTVEKVLKEIKENNKILFDVDFKEPLKNQIENQLNGLYKQIYANPNPGFLIANQCVGRMTQCNDLLLKSSILSGVPIMDAPTSWEYFKWKLEYDAERANPNIDNVSNLHIAKALNDIGGTSLQWLGKIPIEALIELRKTGAINEIRNIINKGVDEISSADQMNFNSTTQRVISNLNKAFAKHQENISELRTKKWKFAGKDIGTWLVSGAIEIAAVFTGTPLFGLSALAIHQILDVPKIKDLPSKAKEINSENEKLKKSPLGILFKYKD